MDSNFRKKYHFEYKKDGNVNVFREVNKLKRVETTLLRCIKNVYLFVL
jgi:hypothetical protein